jgi:hypothetical protein
MHFKYFAWIEGEHWHCQELISEPQIRGLLSSLRSRHQCFCTIQNYDANGNIVSCPIYVDLDGDPEEALADTRYAVYVIEQNLNVTPWIYYSGNKGYHLIIPHDIAHPLAHLIVKHIALNIGSLPTVDKTVYRPRAMLRVNGSRASKVGRFKTQLTRAELFDMTPDKIEKISYQNRMIPLPEIDTAKMTDTDAWEKMVSEAIANLPTFKTVDAITLHAADAAEEMTPCLKSILTQAPPDNRGWNQRIFLLGRFFKRCGIDQDSAVKIFLAQPHFAELDKKEGYAAIRGRMKSLYNSRRAPVLGCKNSDDRDLMKTYCDPWCHFNSSIPDITFAESKR